MKYKRAAAALLAVLMCAVTAGCSGGSHVIITQHTSRTDGISESKPFKTDDSLTKDDITLTVWESKDGPDEWIKKAGESFNSLYPNIHIEYANVELTETTTELLDAKSTVKRPDVFAAPCDMMGELAENGLILPTMDTTFVNTTALALARKAIVYNDVMYGYPTSCETYALFYNKKFIDEKDIPNTWESLITWSDAFGKLYPGKYGFIFHTDTVYYISMLMSSGKNRLMFGSDYGLLNSRASYGLTLLKQMQDILPANVTDYSYDDYDDLFLNGDAAMTVNGPWFIAKADASGVDYGIVPLPDFDNGSNTYSLAGVRTMFVYSKSEHPAEADAFAKYLLSADMQSLRTKITGTLPATNIDVNEKLDGFVDQLEFSYTMPNTAEITRFWEFGEHITADIYSDKGISQELKDYVSYIKNTDKQAEENTESISQDSTTQNE